MLEDLEKKYESPKFDVGDLVISHIKCGFASPPQNRALDPPWTTAGCARFIYDFVD